MDATTLRELLPGGAALPDDLLAALGAGATKRSVDASDVLLRQRAVVDELVVLVDGQVSTYVQFSGAGDLVVETTTRPGRIFGWSGLRNPNRATATVRTDTPSTVVVLPLEIVRDGPPAWTAALCRLVALALTERISVMADEAVGGGVDDA